MLRYLTADKTHWPQLMRIIEGVRSNLPLRAEKVNAFLEKYSVDLKEEGRRYDEGYLARTRVCE